MRLNAPVIGMSVSANGRGYRLVASDGGVFSFGDTAFYGSLGATPGVAAAALAPATDGYWLASTDGEVYKITSGWRAPVAPPSWGAHNYLARIVDKPLRWDPCHTIRVQWNLAGRPYEGILSQALAKVAVATGLTLVPVGATSATIGPDGAADILVVVRRGSEHPINAAWGETNIVGRWSFDRTEQYLTAATISINGNHSASADWVGLNPIGPLLLHELGHAVGLDHVFDIGQVMYPTTSRTEFGPGDLEGLWRVGNAAGCAH